MDFDADSIQDWTGMIAGHPSSILYPNDDDLDGDGVGNLLDPEPLNPEVSRSRLAQNGVPQHLSIEGEAGELQGRLYKEHHILAVNHTDQHSVEVLRAMILLLEKGMPKKLWKSIDSAQVIYAFKGHDPKINIAAYHRNAKALSIGGVSSYASNAIDNHQRIRILSSLAHEIGHAFIFDRMTPSELKDLGVTHGGWKPAFEDASAQSFMDRAFFRAHPLKSLTRVDRATGIKDQKITAQKFIEKEDWQGVSLTSEYAASNLHEWFAESFSATLMNRLGEEGHLGQDWKKNITRLPEVSGGYWVNYNNLSNQIRNWIEQKAELKPLSNFSKSPVKDQ